MGDVNLICPIKADTARHTSGKRVEKTNLPGHTTLQETSTKNAECKPHSKDEEGAGEKEPTLLHRTVTPLVQLNYFIPVIVWGKALCTFLLQET